MAYIITRKLDSSNTKYIYHGWDYKLNLPRLYWNNCSTKSDEYPRVYKSLSRAKSIAEKIDKYISAKRPGSAEFKCEIEVCDNGR